MLRFLVASARPMTATLSHSMTPFMSNLFQACFARGMAKSCLKTNKSAAKRFRVRGSGSIKRNKAGTQHNTGHRTRSRKNNLACSTGIKGKAIEKRIRRLIGK